SQVAPSDATVLITGESGSGKELVAAQVHRLSKRADKNLVRVNCAAISENLFESEFFGHRRGSFTSAVSDRQGRFAEGEGGTLVLDEIGTLRPEMQAKLLRVLETGEYQVVGESQTRVADVRIVAISNENLKARVQKGAFRADLYYRLNVFPVEVPPLRQRVEDIPPLAEYFLARARPGASTPAAEQPGSIGQEALAVLCAYPWPGNVRELRNVMERSVILAHPGIPDAPLFRQILGTASGSPKAAEEEEDLQIRRRVDALERKLLLEALARSKGKKRQAAALLGIDPKNLGYYLAKHQISGEALDNPEDSP
ncbi:MAG: sigma-54-dependent Fis family transcriptional regulator, partial [Planctomycetes bacterium]|nr:sigma-54-dependent Fis family transcriptional regulator [Planctomycetota bacterium]